MNTQKASEANKEMDDEDGGISGSESTVEQMGVHISVLFQILNCDRFIQTASKKSRREVELEMGA